ncbi:metal ABC transporter solute-binding protein, Zn/Mn family [uncultured Duncaniella sp.]|uniref:metal ABC transporter solute-binding protein, Zn/Mn family n=1 Tax=uncultured Duncaniella sp. TaxID=2768039 RepID=UPI002731195D|nr:zinc ABC transporter substrate-binding protein [uncultured Duncaniella sp.]
MKSNNIFFLPIIVSLAAWLGLLVACTATTHDTPIVTVSIEPQKYILEQITGNRVEIRTLIANGANPETFDPSVNHIINLTKSIGFLRMGNIGFEAAILDKVHSENPDLPIFNTSLGVMPVTGTHSHGGITHDVIDPHTWTSVKNVKIISKNMLIAMTEIDPSNADYYRSNYDRFAARLDSLDNELTIRLAPHKGEAFMVWHPSLSYFARDYGLEQITAGNADNKEVAMGTLKETIDHASEHKARIFFYQKDLDSRQAEALSSQLGLTKVNINPLSYEWEKEMTAIADAIAATDTIAE